VLSAFVVLCCFTMVTGSVSEMFLYFLMMFGSLFLTLLISPGLEFVCPPKSDRPVNGLTVIDENQAGGHSSSIQVKATYPAVTAPLALTGSTVRPP
jgi:hypothetical protein